MKHSNQRFMKYIIGLFLAFLLTESLQAQNNGTIVSLYNADSTFVGTGLAKDNLMEGLWKFQNPKTGVLLQISNFSNGLKEGTTIGYFDGKNKKLEAEYKRNKLNGLFKEYDIYGNLRIELVFQDSVPVGPFKEYHAKFSKSTPFDPIILKIEGNYQSGKKEGLWVTYYEINRPTAAIKENYKNGVLDGKYSEFDFEGNLFLEVNFINGDPDGSYKKYVNNKMLWEEGQFDKGRKIGKWQAFFPGTKNIESEKYYDNRGNKTGEWKYYYENKRVARIEKYENDIPVGTWEEFFPNRNISKRKTYQLGAPIGEYIENHSNGDISVSGQYKAGTKDGLWKSYYPDGNLYSIGEYRNDLKTGLWKYFNKIGILIAEGEYNLGAENGQWFYFYDGGQLKTVGSYFLGFEQGTWGLFYDNKQLTQEEYWNNGRLDNIGNYNNINGTKTLEKGTLKDGTGSRITYYVSGKKESEGNYNDGKPNGKWSYFHENEKLASEGQMIGGKKEGLWRYFNNNGLLEQVITFENDEVKETENPPVEINFKNFNQ